jgi:hypothetical protein
MAAEARPSEVSVPTADDVDRIVAPTGPAAPRYIFGEHKGSSLTFASYVASLKTSINDGVNATFPTAQRVQMHAENFVRHFRNSPKITPRGLIVVRHHPVTPRPVLAIDFIRFSFPAQVDKRFINCTFKLDVGSAIPEALLAKFAYLRISLGKAIIALEIEGDSIREYFLTEFLMLNPFLDELHLFMPSFPPGFPDAEKTIIAKSFTDSLTELVAKYFTAQLQ